MVKTKLTYKHEKVSIIITMFNRATLLPETLDSVIAQTYDNWECILVDDESTDNTLAVAREYARKDSRFRVYSRPSNIRKGANGCRNYGFNLSDGEFIQWFDSDDLMTPALLEKSLSCFAKDTDFVISSFAHFDSENKKIEYNNNIYTDLSKEHIFEILRGDKHFGTPQALFRKKFIQKSDCLFNESIFRNQETEFYIRLLLMSPKINLNSHQSILVRRHNQSISGAYYDKSGDQRLLQDFPAYLLIYKNCKKSNAISERLFELFRDFTFRCLRKGELDNLNYYKMFYWGIKEHLFPSSYLAFKIFFSRLKQKLQPNLNLVYL